MWMGLCRLVSEKLGRTLGASELYDKDRLIGILDPQDIRLVETLHKVEQVVEGPYLFDYILFDPVLRAFNNPGPSGLELAAGGLIKQHIQADTHPVSTWDHWTKTVFNVQLISARAFEEMTGFKALSTPQRTSSTAYRFIAFRSCGPWSLKPYTLEGEDRVWRKEGSLSFSPSRALSSQEGGVVEENYFYPNFDDEATEIPGLPFGSSAQEVWSRIYSAGLITGRNKPSMNDPTSGHDGVSTC
ncbi:hypothetical protein EYB25_007394 [Talaromyces marneffei]|nr:hypothetical protein EYB25_007394 [Talaromyces marneffei]